MKLTKNELTILRNYYSNLKFDVHEQIEDLKVNCQGVIESDLYEIQLNRYVMKIKEYEDRMYELENDPDNL